MKKSKLIITLGALILGVILILAVLLVLILSALLGQKVPLVITTESYEAVYDATPLTYHKWSLAEGSLKSGHTLYVTVTGTQTEVGQCENTVSVVIKDEMGADVTSDYDIKFKLGMLSVLAREITVTSSDAEKIYDGKPLYNDGHFVSPDNTVSGVVQGQRLIVNISGYIVEPGVAHNTIERVTVLDEFGRDVSSNYIIRMREGLLTVYESDGSYPGGGVGPGEGGGDGENPGEGPGEGNTGNGPGGGDPGILEGIGSGDGSGDGSGNGSGGGGFSGNLGGNGNSGNGGNVDVNYLIYKIFSETQTGGMYLRNKSFGNYNGKGWESASEYKVLLNDRYSPMAITSIAYSTSTEFRVRIEPFIDAYVLPYFLGMRGRITVTSDTEFTGDTSNPYTAYYVAATNSSEKLPEAVAEYEKKYREFVYDNYLYVDDETLNFMKLIIEEEGFDTSDPMIIDRVAMYIRQAASYNLKYDTGLDACSNIVISFLDTYKEGVCRHYASAATLLYRALGIPARYTVGAYAETKAGEWVDVYAGNAHAWVEVYFDGLGWIPVEVTGSSNQNVEDKKIEIKPVTEEKIYDGEPLVPSGNVSGLERFEAQGYKYEAVVKGEITEVGYVITYIDSLIIYDSAGNDVTDKYEIVLKEGKNRIYRDILRFESPSYKGTYGEGSPDPAVLVSGKTLETEKIRISMLVPNPGVGSSLNYFDVMITDADGNDVRDCYKIEKVYGKMTVSAASLTVKAGSATKKFDSSELTCDEYEIVGGELVGKDKILICETEGSQTKIGRSENVISYIMIVDENGNDVTGNYHIEFEAGTLRVTP